MATSRFKALLSAMDDITGTGIFCDADSRPFFMPGLWVDGVGEISFPLVDVQARKLIAVAEAAPHGKGLKTVRDDRVRRCWQIDASAFEFRAPEWADYIAETLAAAAERMGIRGKVTASPYKLLIYEKGGHFLAHRDTEKLEAMFGTLIVALPSAHAGGCLRVRHRGEEEIVDFSRAEGTGRFQSVALYADCEHEVEPVESGVRFCAVYNLTLKTGDPSTLNRGLEHHVESLVPLLARLDWAVPPRPAAVLLEHRYTETNFSLQQLKGHDALRAEALLLAAEAADYVAHLALITLHRVGDLLTDYEQRRYSSRYRARYGYGYDEDDEEDGGDGEMGDVHDESITADGWRDAEDRRVKWPAFSLPLEALISTTNLSKDEPDEKESEGYTGNAGCTIEYWYRRAAVVLWPRRVHETVLCSTSFPTACAELASMAAKSSARERPEFRRLADAVLAQFPEKLPPAHYFSRHGAEGDDFQEPFDRTLLVLVKAGLADEMAGLIRRVPAGAFGLVSSGTIDAVVKRFGAGMLAPVVKALLADPEAPGRKALFPILDAFVSLGHKAEALQMLRDLARQPTPTSVKGRSAGASEPFDHGPRELAIFVRAGRAVADEADVPALMPFVRGTGSLAFVRGRLAPVLLEIARNHPEAIMATGSLGAAALAFARAQLADEIAKPLAPYPDWRRPCPLPADDDSSYWYRHFGSTADLRKELLTFMADPEARTHRFLRKTEERDQIEEWIRSLPLDLDARTVKTGRPYHLECTKNSKSYEKAMAVRSADKALHDQLGKIE